VLPYDVLDQLARDRCQQRLAQAQAERLVLPKRAPGRRHSLPTLALIARVRRQAARA
jgi:hypothetical protein